MADKQSRPVGTRTAKDWGLSEVAQVIFKRVGFEPTGEEQAAVLRSGKRFKQVVGGAQAGKSITISKDFDIHLMEDRAKWPDDSLLYWLVALDYDKTRAEFGFIAEDLRKLGLPVNVSKRVDPGFIEVRSRGVPPGGAAVLRIETKSAKDPRSLAMFAPHGIMICEASQVDLETYLRCMERVAPKRGWMDMSGTLDQGSLGWYPALAKAWEYGGGDAQSFVLPSTSNWHLYPGGVNDPEILRLKAASSDAFFMERIMGIASPPKGIVFPEFRPDIHVRAVEWEKGEPVYLWEDPGYGSESAHAIEVAQIGKDGQVRVFDEIFEQGKITEDIIEICKGREWWQSPKFLVSDPHYRDQHHSMTSVGEIWLARTGLVAAGERGRINDGTERLKGFLKPDPLTGVPKIVFNPRCKGILSELGYGVNPFNQEVRVYSWKVDRDGNIFGEVPEDKWNHGVKAVIYGLVDHFGYVTAGGSQVINLTYHGGNNAKRHTSHLKGAGMRVR